MKQLILLLLLILGTFTAEAQMKYGFKTGLNFAHIDGESEIGTDGANLESWKNTTGFHIGMTLSYKFTDHFGLRGELLYSKRGGKYTFDGPSYRIFRHTSGSILTTGTSKYLINVNNSYIDLPVMAYGRFGDFEISGGGYVGFLVQSGGEGSLQYSGKTALGNAVYANPDKTATLLDFNLNHNYRKDDPGAGSSESDTEVPINVKVDGFISETPKTMGAYYDQPQGKDHLYTNLDFGLVGGISYYISSALYFGVRLQYGLADITNKGADLSKGSVDSNGGLIFRDDKDRNFMIQASVGFSF